MIIIKLEYIIVFVSSPDTFRTRYFMITILPIIKLDQYRKGTLFILHFVPAWGFRKLNPGKRSTSPQNSNYLIHQRELGYKPRGQDTPRCILRVSPWLCHITFLETDKLLGFNY